MVEHFEWVKRIIESCIHPFHLESAKRVVEVFKERYGECEEYVHLLDSIEAKDSMLMVV